MASEQHTSPRSVSSADLWRRWRTRRDPADRERLILQHAPLVKYVAGRLTVGVTPTVDLGDLISSGMFGLIDAIERFDPDRGVAFETYAMPRVRGAIVDELRATDWVPRSVRDQARAIRTAVAELEASSGRTPDEDELAAALGVGVDRLRHMLGQISLTSLAALDDLFDDERGRSLADTLHDPTAADPQGRVEDVEQRTALVAAVRRLPERERTVVILYYFEGMTLAQVGEVLGVTESRVSQLHARAVLSLRAKLASRRLAPSAG